MPLHSRTIPLDPSERDRIQISELVQYAAAYNYEKDHFYMTKVAVGNHEFFLELASPLPLLALHWIDERGTADFMEVWEDGQNKAIAEGEVPLREYNYVVPVLRVTRITPALDCLWRVLGAAGMSWQEAEQMPTEDTSVWKLPDGSAFSFQPEWYIMVAKLECFLCAPSRVEASEVLDYIPQADSFVFLDRANHINAVTEPLGVLVSKAVVTCGA